MRTHQAMVHVPAADSSCVLSSDSGSSPPRAAPPPRPPCPPRPPAKENKGSKENKESKETAEERRLVELLRKASLTIKAERARSADFQREVRSAREENAALREEIDALRAQLPPPSALRSAAPRTRRSPSHSRAAAQPQSPAEPHWAPKDLWRASAGDVSPYCAGMLSRLRRAMAPPPTREQLGEVVHAMVKEIVRDARRRGVDLRMVKQAPCVYKCTRQLIRTVRAKAVAEPSRVLHLSIDSGRLTVKLGGGHENLLEYLERHRYFAVV